jgi:hypothetical protein
MTAKDTKPAPTTTRREHTKPPSENDIDQSVEDTFPASDPPAQGGSTKIIGKKPAPETGKGQAPRHK